MKSWKTVLLSLILCFVSWAEPAFAQTTSIPVTPPPGIIGWWSFDETSGNQAFDRMGMSPGTWENNPTPTTGIVRGCLEFNGQNYVNVADSSLWAFGNNDFSIEFWVNFSSAQGGSNGEPSSIFVGNDEGSGDQNKWFFALGGGDLEFHINSPTLGAQFFPLVPFSPTVGQWYHLAIVRSGFSYTIYINGVPSGTATNTNTIPTANAPLTIGEAEQIGFLNGKMDELTIYNQALSTSQIQSIYNAGSAGKAISLSAFPAQGGNTGTVSVHIAGVGFDQSAKPSLTMSGQKSIMGGSVSVAPDGSSLDAVFDLTGAVPDEWNVQVANPTGPPFLLQSGFTIEPGGGGGDFAGTFDPTYISSHLTSSIVGLSEIEVGRAEDYAVTVQNSGNVDANNVSVLIGLPKTCNATITLSPTEIYNYTPAKAGPSNSNVVVIQVNIGKVGTSSTFSIPVNIQLNDGSVTSLWSNCYDVELINGSRRRPGRGVRLPARIGPNWPQDNPQITIITIDAATPPTATSTGEAIIHSYLEIGDTVYCVRPSTPPNYDPPTLDSFPAADLPGLEEEAMTNHVWEVDPGDVNSNGGTPIDNVSQIEFISTNVTNANFPQLFQGSNLQDMIDDLNTDIGMPTGGNCITTLNDVTLIFGLNMGPAVDANEGDDTTFPYLEQLGIDFSDTYAESLLLAEGIYGPISSEQANPWIAGGTPFNLSIVSSFDPNNLSGPLGHGADHIIDGLNPLNYYIEFENSPKATAPAQQVVVNDQLDPKTMDLTSVSLGPITFGSNVITPGRGANSFATDVDLRPAQDLIVRIVAGLNPVTGILTWSYTAIDPATGTIPTNPEIGFLPPDVHPPAGLGSTQFTVNPKSGLTTGTSIKDTAQIVFDLNAPILTPTWTNVYLPSVLSGLTLETPCQSSAITKTNVITLTGDAPAGGAAVAMTSSNPSIVPPPKSVIVPYGTGTTAFNIGVNPVSANTWVTITASFGGVTKTATLEILAPVLSGLTLQTPCVAGTVTTTNVITLTGDAATGGAAVPVTSNRPSLVTVPKSVVVPYGTSTTAFAINTGGVSATTYATIKASFGGKAFSAFLTIEPASLSSFTVDPTSTIGGGNSNGTIHLNGEAGPSGAVVTLSANSGDVTIPTSVTVASGETTASFPITTKAVKSTTVVTITATFGKVTRYASLTLTP